MLDRFFSTLSVVSRIPVKVKFTFDASRMDFYLPFTGVCAALPALLLFVICSRFFNFPVLTAAFILLAQYLGFNLFHLDGLMDTADAFLGSADREKRLAILKDSRVGVYGFFAGFAVLGLKAALLYTLLPIARDFAALVFAWPLWGRFSAALVPCLAPPQSANRLGALAKDARLHRCFAGAVLALLLWALLVWLLLKLAALAGPPPFSPLFAGNDPVPAVIAPALCLFAVCPLTALYYARLYRKSLGGYTGDALGAAIETAELLCLAATLAVLRAKNLV